MKQVIIENPIINSAFSEPKRHFRFDDDGITSDIVKSRRISHYFIPIAQPKKKGKQTQQLELDLGEWTQDRVQENKFINDIRQRVGIWRGGGYVGVTPTTRRLLEYWQHPDRERKLYFCQIEALETIIYITEVAKKYGDNWIENQLRQFNADANPLLFRMACKMATGSGKTVVMSMMIAWHSLNKIANPQNRLFSDAFLVVTPGVTVKDRLRVLQPNDGENYYKKLDLVPPDLMPELDKAKILITNYHGFKPREITQAGKLTKDILSQGKESAFTETPEQMVRRVCKALGNKKNIIVINDEAHHCYRRRVDDDDAKLKGDDRKEAEKRNDEARLWISGIEAISAKIGVKVVYDLSATPFFLKGSGYPEGNLFPWVVSDFSLIDAIESGIVKIPRVPVSDNNMKGELPTYRSIWPLIRDHLPKKGRGTQDESKTTLDPKLPKELEGALQSLYSNYEKAYRQWEENTEAHARGLTPPVFIVVCNNTNVSKLVYDYVSGWDTNKRTPDEKPILAPGKLKLFSNVENGNWTARPNTILVDSEQLESGEAMSADFKKIAAREIEEFKAEYRRRYPGQDPEKITSEDLLREVLNTVGKPDKLGEQIRCVISVSMLTEGWDANTVTHILGVRAFGTHLLCEQVVGRGLRRISYAVNEEGMYEPEYAEVYGVPFAFIPCAGANKKPKLQVLPTRVRPLEERIDLEITFPRLIGYRYDISQKQLNAKFTDACKYAISPSEIPTLTVNAPIVGQSSIHTLDDLRSRRKQEVAFLLAKLTLEKYFRGDGTKKTDKPKEHIFDADVQAWLFPQVLRITKEWMQQCVIYKGNTYPQLLLLTEYAHDAADYIYRAIASGEAKKSLKPILRPYDTFGSTRYVNFDTTRPVYATDPNKCHVSHVVADTDSWEQKTAQVLEEMDEVVSYVKNHNLGFTIPYTISGEQKNYIPDFIVRIQNGHKKPLNLILEVSGEARKDKAVKVDTARSLWIPAVNNHGSLGHWEFLEISDPWDAQNTIRHALCNGNFN
ncbi:BPTD_3080 family restriction endonuclease [Umezakia ovalisporum]|uniref:DEAD/DEAH box helicase family protein n=1 Tax=Umezakia ovalisporum FSS-43 TaxID=2740520 RepID=A0ABT6K2G9_9CYAN|nr:DEAD/DEAH box helicase family protein [Umezakia ovalisporum]MDH6056548.1 DEAD/DEAH box helicase family protein [Umezakia ovalisporum FSS-43]MDH6069298.1 DEAD/DEAH box helicase family protein [Umezakia ovalisporum CobakiLakeA]MDH6080848.1 DEAD/DEAH box helicase family protein [Umezakia ovalisporum FSS-44]MDH6094715.1 DEAD/DEAH box helicase family protein [Umezakia ovalisporum CobakiLakeB]